MDKMTDCGKSRFKNRFGSRLYTQGCHAGMAGPIGPIFQSDLFVDNI